MAKAFETGFGGDAVASPRKLVYRFCRSAQAAQGTGLSWK
jgi:hypothetical protein